MRPVDLDALWDQVAVSLAGLRDRESHEDAILFLLAAPNNYVFRYALTRWQRFRHPILTRRIDSSRSKLLAQGQVNSTQLEHIDSMLGRVEFGRNFSAKERHNIRQQCLRLLLNPSKIHLAFSGAGLRQSNGRFHLWTQPRWLLRICIFAESTSVLLAIICVSSAIWSLEASGQIGKETISLAYWSIYFAWMKIMANSIGREWRDAQFWREKILNSTPIETRAKTVKQAN